MSSPEGEESNPGGLPVGGEESQVRFYRPWIGDLNIPKLANTQRSTSQYSEAFYSEVSRENTEREGKGEGRRQRQQRWRKPSHFAWEPSKQFGIFSGSVPAYFLSASP